MGWFHLSPNVDRTIILLSLYGAFHVSIRVPFQQGKPEFDDLSHILRSPRAVVRPSPQLSLGVSLPAVPCPPLGEARLPTTGRGGVIGKSIPGLRVGDVPGASCSNVIARIAIFHDPEP